MMPFEKRLTGYRDAVNAYLDGLFADALPQRTVLDAMRYSLLAGGKRIRPVLVLEFCRVSGGEWEKALPFAAALEMVHTYSLIHDDLPCMDNDDYRRGRLTNHKVYGEANAVLAGDGLLTAAFGAMSGADCDPSRTVAAIRTLSVCAGELGMVGGQVLDLEAEEKKLSEAEILTIHRLKTGALLKAACQVGTIVGGGSDAQVAAAGAYAESLGLAFQTRDDMLDVIGDAKKLGKATGMDGKKNTFVRLYGLEACEKMVQEETGKAIAALLVFPEPEFLTELAKRLADRDH